MAQFIMLMKGSGKAEDWAGYIEQLIKTGKFRGGSELSNGTCQRKGGNPACCTVTGYMHFEADSTDDIIKLLPGNPVYEAGGSVEVLEIVQS